MRNTKDYGMMVKEWMKENDIISITNLTINAKKWDNTYGCLAYTDYNTGDIGFMVSPKKIWKFIHNWYYRVNTRDNEFNLFVGSNWFVIPENNWVFMSDYLIRLANGILYDIADRYWYNRADSRKLKEAIKAGYKYVDVCAFFDQEREIELEILDGKIEAIIDTAIDEVLTFDGYPEKVEAIKEYIVNSFVSGADSEDVELYNQALEIGQDHADNYLRGWKACATFSIKRSIAHEYITADSKVVWAKKVVQAYIDYDYYRHINPDKDRCYNVAVNLFDYIKDSIEEAINNEVVTLDQIKDTIFNDGPSNSNLVDAIDRVSGCFE